MSVTSEELRGLRADLLRHQIRVESARADVAEMEAATRLDQERDRLVKTGRQRILPILDVIVPDTAERYIDALMHWERRDPGQDITILINSPGGSITDGLAVYDTIERLRRKGHRVTTHGSGIVASMAGVLLQAGDERILDKRAKMLIHEGSQTFSRGTQMTAAQIEDQQFLSKMLREDILDILAERSTLTKEELQQKWERRDWWLNAEEALELGFADRIE